MKSDQSEMADMPRMPETGLYPIGVRALCEFTARTGDLDLRFTPAPTAAQGVAGHAQVQDSRPAGYEIEVPLSGCHSGLLVRGRADGFDPQARRLEEIKTHRGPVAAIRANQHALHRAQAMVYAHLLCASRGLTELTVALVYWHIERQEETVFEETHSASSLAAFFARQCEAFAAFARAEQRHRHGRDAALARLAFPLPRFRAGQRELSVAVFRALRDGHELLAQAPTGIGKTLGCLFPALKVWPQAGLDKLFFLTAKGPGRQVALDALHLLARQMLDEGATAPSSAGEPSPQPFVGESCGGKDDDLDVLRQYSNDDIEYIAEKQVYCAKTIRILNLISREKSCLHPDLACHGESCPLARGFYDRLPAARAQALARMGGDTQAVAEAAQAHAVCPYYLAQELVRWSDVVVADYSQYYDRHAVLAASAQANGWRVAVLVDEAHNLLDRARHMHTATLTLRDLLDARRQAPKALLPSLNRLRRAMGAVLREQHADYAAHDAVPVSLLRAVRQSSAVLGEWLAQAPLKAQMPQSQQAPLLNLHFELLQFLALAEDFGPHALFDVQREVRAQDAGAWPSRRARHDRAKLIAEASLAQQPADAAQLSLDGLTAAGDADGKGEEALPAERKGASRERSSHAGHAHVREARFCIRCVVPAPHLAPRHALAHATVLFSGTLGPAQFQRDMLGLPEDTPWLDVASPFRPEQLSVQVARHISTRYADRNRSLVPLADWLAAQMTRDPGNYLCFVSSFAYLAQLQVMLAERHAHLTVWAQSPQMDEAQRQAFLARFTPHSAGLGLAVLGGAFGEGVDLPGRRLIGVFIATLGMPQLNSVNEAMCERLRQRYGRSAGHDYAYLYPGLHKVVQAAGRVIRSEQDRGCVHLLDDRYLQRRVQALLPAWWQLQSIDDGLGLRRQWEQ